MKSANITLRFIAVAAAFALYDGAEAQYAVPTSVIANGGQEGTGGGYTIAGTAGQYTAGTMSGAASTSSGGFWYTGTTNVPSAPQNLSAIAGFQQVILRWNKNSEPNFLRYRIYGGTSPNPTVKTDSTTGGVTDTVKTITGLTNGVTYFFRVSAVDSAGGESAYSNEVSATPQRPPAAFSEVEPNDSASVAMSIIFGDTVNAAIRLSGDVDYYKFFAAAGDTIEINVDTLLNSTLDAYAVVYDSVGNTYAYGYYPSTKNIHVIVPIYSTTTYYIRVYYPYAGSASFPNSAHPGVPGRQDLMPHSNSLPSIQSSVSGAAATNDTGAYRLRLRRFSPSAPEIWFTFQASTFSNSVVLGGYFLPNGSNTTVQFQYGPTDAYGNIVEAKPNPISGIYNPWAEAPIAGLLPATSYHYRAVLRNSKGITTGPDNVFSTAQTSNIWTRQEGNVSADLHGVFQINSTTAVAVGGWGSSNSLDRILRTTDGGATWSSQGTSDNNALYGVWFYDAKDGWAVGSGGTILRTTDGGSTWTKQITPVTNWLQSVSFSDANNGVAVGDGAIILGTTDGGSNWSIRSNLGSGFLWTVRHASPSVVVAVGDPSAILRSTNGGTTWERLANPTGYYLYGLWFSDPNKGFAVGGNGNIIKTTDAGATWTQVTGQSINNWLYGVWFYDANRGIAVGDGGAIYRTTDGGSSWKQDQSGTYNTLFGVHGFGRSAMVVGSYGAILNLLGPLQETESNNTIAQANLTAINDAVSGSISPAGDVDFFKFKATVGDTLEAYANAAANSSLQSGLVWVYDRLGNLRGTASSFPTPTSQHLVFVATTDTFLVRYAAGSSDSGTYQIRLRRFSPSAADVRTNGALNIYSNTADINASVAPNGLNTNVEFDYGTTIAYVNTIPYHLNPLSGINIQGASRGISGLTANTTYHFRARAQNAIGSATGTDVVFTTPAPPDGWVRQFSGTGQFLLGVSFLNTSKGTAVGTNGTILKTTNGGATWFTQNSGITALLRGVSFTDTSTGTAVGIGGTILRTTNGGETWTGQTSGTTVYLRAVKFLNSNMGVAVGFNGTILKTTNGGTNWTSQVSNTTNALLGVSLIDGNTYVAVGDGGTILRTTDGGANWVSQGSPTTQSLFGAWFFNSATGIVTGAGGTILRTTDSGVNWTTIPSSTADILYTPIFPASNSGIIVGSSGVVLRSTDQGASWTSQSSGTLNQLVSVSFAHPDTGTAVGEFGAVLRYSRAAAAPAAPILASPIDAATNQARTLTLQWNPSPTATSYHVQLARDAAMTTFVVNDSTLVDTSRVVGNLSYSAQYYWRVRAKNVAGNSGFSSVRSFTTEALPAPSAPALVTPLDGATNQSQSLTLKWNTSATATSYRLQLGTDQTFVSGIFKDTTTADTVKSVSELAANTTYYWHVSATNFTGPGLFSSTYSFQTQAASAPIVTTNAATGVSLNSAILNATVNPNGLNTSYYFDYGQTTSYGFTTVAKPIGAGDTLVSVRDTVRNLAGNTLYHYRVVATNPQGQVLGSDLTFTTVTLPSAPAGLQVVTFDASSVTLAWADNSTNEETFRLERRLSSGSFAEVKQLQANTTTYQDTSLTANATYLYRVRAFNSAGFSDYSNEVSVTTILAPRATLSATNVNFGTREVSFDRRDSVLTLTNAGSADLFVLETPKLSGSDTSHFQIASISRSGSFFRLTPGQFVNVTVRFEPITTGNKTVFLEFRTDDTLQYGPTGVVRGTLTGTGADTTAPSQTIAVVSPAGWTNAGPLTLTWGTVNDASGIAKLWYKYDSPPTTTDPGNSVNVQTSTTAQVPAPTVGVHLLYYYLEDGSGNRKVSTYGNPVTVKYDTTKPTINPAAVGKVTITGTSVTSNLATINASVTKAAALAGLVPSSVKAQYRKSVDVSWQDLSLGGTIPDPAFLTGNQPNGVEYRIVASDSAGNSSAKGPYSVVIEIVDPPQSPFVPPAAGTDPSTQVFAYRMFSVPYDLSDRRPSSIVALSDFGGHVSEGVNYVNWRMQRVLNNGQVRQDYEDIKDLQVFAPGEAVFLIVKETKTIKVGSGKVVKLDSLSAAGIPLSAGWNLFGNPLLFRVPRESLNVSPANLDSWAYFSGTSSGTSGWEVMTGKANMLEPWEGLALKVSAATTLRFKWLGPQSAAVESPKSTASRFVETTVAGTSDSWLIRLDASRTDNNMKSLNNLIGMVPGANDGYDSFDWFMPPFIGEKNVALYFRSSDGAMMRDIRPVNADGQVWEMRVVTGDRSARVKIDLSGAKALPNPAFVAYLLDLDESMAHDLRQTSSIEINSSEGRRNFKVIVGTKAFADAHRAGIDLVPTAFKLFANYPNPFNPETVIRYTIPGSQEHYRVTLKIYNLVGQEVATLVESDQKPGYYEVKFDGRNMSSGVYFYRMTINGGSKETTLSDVKRMMLLK